MLIKSTERYQVANTPKCWEVLFLGGGNLGHFHFLLTYPYALVPLHLVNNCTSVELCYCQGMIFKGQMFDFTFVVLKVGHSGVERIHPCDLLGSPSAITLQGLPSTPELHQQWWRDQNNTQPSKEPSVSTGLQTHNPDPLFWIPGPILKHDTVEAYQAVACR